MKGVAPGKVNITSTYIQNGSCKLTFNYPRINEETRIDWIHVSHLLFHLII